MKWSLIQLRMENQHNIIPMGRLHGVTIDIEGASKLDNFEVIEIVDDNNAYPTLLPIDWAIDMNGVFDLKKQTMLFERKIICMVVPLDPAEEPRYNELVYDYEESDDDLEQIYKVIMGNQYSVNLTADGKIAWDGESSYISDLKN